MTKTNRFKHITLRFLKGNLSEAEETKLLDAIKSGEYPQTQFLADQNSIEDDVIQSENTATDKAWSKFLKVNKLPVRARPQTRLKFNRSEYLSVAAAFVIGILITSAFFTLYFSRFESKTDMREVYIPLGAKSKVELPDGSSVWLNSGTKISYPAVYRGRREVTLDGEGYFEVVKSKVPFSVKTAKGNVEVLGTSFNVQSYPHEDFRTTLVTGSVRLTAKSGIAALLKPGEQAQISEAGELVVKQVNPEDFTSWKEGRLIFHREPFSVMSQRLERWYNVKIEIKDEELKDLWFTGSVEMETLSEFLALIELTYPVEYNYDSKTRRLTLEKRKK